MEIEQLKALIDKHADGNQARFALMLGKSPSQVNQWLAGKRPMGAKIERDIAARFGPMTSKASNVGSAGAALTAAESLSASLRHIAGAMIDADEIAVIQAKPLLTHLIDHPDQADKIIPRLVATLDGPSLSTETKDFVKTHAKQPS